MRHCRRPHLRFRLKSSACWRCGLSVVPPRLKPARSCLAARPWPMRFFAPIAVRLRTYQVKLPEVDAAYVETIYQWPAFKAWRKAALEEIER